MNYRRQSGYFQIGEGLFVKTAQGIAKNMHEVLFIMKFWQTKRHNQSMKKTYCEVRFTVVENLTEEGESLDLRQIFSSF